MVATATAGAGSAALNRMVGELTCMHASIMGINHILNQHESFACYQDQARQTSCLYTHKPRGLNRHTTDTCNYPKEIVARALSVEHARRRVVEEARWQVGHRKYLRHIPSLSCMPYAIFAPFPKLKHSWALCRASCSNLRLLEVPILCLSIQRPARQEE
jgi:hypothetical protein